MSSASDYRRLTRGVIPYATVDGADKAIEFYTRAFGAVPHGEVARSEDGRVLNASIEINDGMVMLMDPFPSHGSDLSSGSNFLLQLVIADGDPVVEPRGGRRLRGSLAVQARILGRPFWPRP